MRALVPIMIVAFPLHALISLFNLLFPVEHFSRRQVGRRPLALLYLTSSSIIHHIDESRLNTSVQQHDGGKVRKVKTLSTIAQLPNVPAVYALYGGQSRGLHVAYVGETTKLKSRILQHLVTRDSSVTTGMHAVSLNPEYVTRVEWWEYPDFADSSVRGAAELLAFDVLAPVLRSRGAPQEQAQKLYQDEEFRNKLRRLFQGEPSGSLSLPPLQERVSALEARMIQLEQRIVELEGKRQDV
jgi:hypothetical protein